MLLPLPGPTPMPDIQCRINARDHAFSHLVADNFDKQEKDMPGV